MADSMYCEHNRTANACEDCAYNEAVAAGRPVGGPPPAETRAANEALADLVDAPGVANDVTPRKRLPKRVTK